MRIFLGNFVFLCFPLVEGDRIEKTNKQTEISTIVYLKVRCDFEISRLYVIYFIVDGTISFFIVDVWWLDFLEWLALFSSGFFQLMLIITSLIIRQQWWSTSFWFSVSSDKKKLNELIVHPKSGSQNAPFRSVSVVLCNEFSSDCKKVNFSEMASRNNDIVNMQSDPPSI